MTPLLAQFFAAYGPVQWLIVFVCALALVGVIVLFVRYMKIPISERVMEFFWFVCGVVGIVFALLICVWGIRQIAGQL